MSKCEDFFKGYPSKGSVSAQVTWLRSVVLDDMDPDLYECIINAHKIKTSADYDSIVRDYWGAKTPVYTEISLKDIKDDYFDKPINYEFYISLTPDGDDFIWHELTSKFTLDPPCYSVPFFEALYKEYGKVLLRFTLGMYQGKKTIVFYVKGMSDSFYDFSQIPPFTKDGEPSIIAV